MQKYSNWKYLFHRKVNLGVIHENPSTTVGAMRILDYLNTYAPQRGENFVKIPVHGDALSVERMVKALELRSASQSPKGSLEGIESIPQEFHKRGIVLQVPPPHLHIKAKKCRLSHMNCKLVAFKTTLLV